MLFSLRQENVFTMGVVLETLVVAGLFTAHKRITAF